MALTRLKSPQAAARWLAEWVNGTLRTDSRRVKPGDAFIAWPGYAQDGRRFVPAALAAGATTCVVESEGVGAFGFDDARVAALPDLKAATGAIAHEFFGRPSEGLKVIATTGTNGKTSTAWWTAQALTLLGQRCGVIGTLGVGEPPTRLNSAAQVDATGLTTPDPVTLHAAFRTFVDAGFAACAIEASSIGIVERRLDAAQLAVALFTNFTPDHLDYHGTMEMYWAAKRELFDWPGLQAAVLNADDPAGAALADELSRPEGTRAAPLDVWTYSVLHDARLRAGALTYENGGLSFVVTETGEVPQRVRTGLIGDYNVSNVLAVLGGLRALGIPLDQCIAAAGEFTPVPGRMQRVEAASEQPQAVVDYAHTPDALEKALHALRRLALARGGKLWCVFGCGGNRDATKRPVMGRIAAELADRVIVTSDNPRSEDPQDIVRQIRAGCPDAAHVSIEVDRRAAIALALRSAGAADVLLLAGKGHEDYQEIQSVRQPFSDIDEAVRGLAQRGVA